MKKSVKRRIRFELVFRNLHDVVMIPKYAVRVEFCWRIEPKIDPLFSVTFAVGIHISLDCVRLSGAVAQELEI